MTSHILTKEMVQIAVRLVHATFIAAGSERLLNDNRLHIVVMDPTQPYYPDADFQSAILYEESFGEESKDFTSYARSKARISWKYRMNTQTIRDQYPFLYLDGMVAYVGGVFMHEMAVGASGVQSQMDQMFAEMVISACRAMSLTEMRQITDNKIAFIGDVKR